MICFMFLKSIFQLYIFNYQSEKWAGFTFVYPSGKSLGTFLFISLFPFHLCIFKYNFVSIMPYNLLIKLLYQFQMNTSYNLQLFFQYILMHAFLLYWSYNFKT